MITEEQLDEVDQFLASAKLTDDYLLEFKDHVLCELEIEMEAGLSFENSFEKVKEKWIIFLMPKNSWLLGLTNMFPAIMIKKLTYESLKNLMISGLMTICIIVPYFIFRDKMSESTSIIIRSIVLLVAIGCSTYFTLKFRFNKQKYFTSIYSSRLRIQSYSPAMFCVFYVLLFGVLSNFDRLNQISLETIFYSAFAITDDMHKTNANFLILYVFFAVSNLRLYFLHQKVMNKLQIIYEQKTSPF